MPRALRDPPGLPGATRGVRPKPAPSQRYLPWSQDESTGLRDREIYVSI